MSNTEELVKLPFGKQFSPSQIELKPILDFIADNEPTPDEFKEYVLETFFGGSHRTKALNTYIALRDYKIAEEREIVEEGGNRKAVFLTDIGASIKSSATEVDFYNTLAKHILNELHGIVMIESIEDLNKMGEKITASSIAEVMTMKGYDAGGNNGEKLNPIKLWLEKAGVFLEGRSWGYDPRRLEEVLGVGVEQIEALRTLNRAQAAFLQTYVKSFEARDNVPHNTVAEAAEKLHEVKYDWKQIPKQILSPLVDKGFVEIVKTTVGRGAKPYLVKKGPNLDESLSSQIERTLQAKGIEITEYFKRPLSEFIEVVTDASQSIQERGFALEGVAFHVCRLLNLRVMGWRKRSADTGYSEVDLIAESPSNMAYIKYQLQCKVSDIAIEHVDREVGVSLKLKSNVILFITSGNISATAARSAIEYMKNTNLNIFFINGNELQEIILDESKILDIITRQTYQIRTMKNPTD
ncbi:restriction endonuclease [Gorillibacterium sp. CAU 1737]|uniref:restriction endonuclease n=1 Tax=Gorillibacterium sp. CAU 1737 TaxID=3140362 RepID=UPI00326175D4